MIIDSRLEFSVAQAITADAASTNTIDLGSDRDIGVGQAMWVIIQVDVAADATTGDETYSIILQTDDNSSFSSATNIATYTPTAAMLTAGSRHVIGMPLANERYLRLNYDVGGTTPTVTLSAWLTDQEPTKWTAYPDGI